MPGKRTVERACRVCGKSFFPTQQQISKGHGVYCSHECHGLTMRGVPIPDERRAAISAAHLGKKFSDERRAKHSAAQKGTTRGTPSSETRAKISAALLGRPLSAEHRASVSATKRGTTLSDEHKAKLSAALKGKTRSPEHQAKISAANTGKALSQAHRASLSAAHKGKLIPLDVRAKLSIALKTSKKAAEHRRTMYRLRGCSSIERLVAAALTARGIAFAAEAPIGSYFADFLVGDSLVIECDGEYWHSKPRRIEQDRRRDAWMMERGYTIIRLSESEIRSDVVAAVDRALAPLEVAAS